MGLSIPKALLVPSGGRHTFSCVSKVPRNHYVEKPNGQIMLWTDSHIFFFFSDSKGLYCIDPESHSGNLTEPFL